jgi:hypothetical protein
MVYETQLDKHKQTKLHHTLLTKLRIYQEFENEAIRKQQEKNQKAQSALDNAETLIHALNKIKTELTPYV